MVAAILEASRFIDQEVDKKKTATILADKAYVNTAMEVIEDRWEGKYTNGLGKSWADPNAMKFHLDGAVNYPYLSDGMWFLTQHKRWGLLKEHPDYAGVAKAINKIDLYKQAATAAKVAIPKSEMRSSKLIDGITWDGSNPRAYADGFKIKGGAA
jgi:nitrate/nitrite transport system substrate-binding protein